MTRPHWDPSHCNAIQPQCEAQEKPCGTEPRKTWLLLLRELFVMFKGWELPHSPWRLWLLHLVAITTTGFTPSSALPPPAVERSLRLGACSDSQRLRISLRTSIRESPQPVPCSSPSLHTFWAGEGTGTAPDSGRAPGGLRNIPGSQAKIAEEEQTFPFSLEPINKTPLATSTALSAEGQRRAHLLSSPLLSSHKAPSPVPQSEQELTDPSGHGAAPRHPPTSQPPHRKETKKSWRGLIDLSTEDTSFGLITPFCPVTNILKTYKKKNKLHPSYTKRHV